LTERVETRSKIHTEVSREKGKEAGVVGIHAIPGLETAKFGAHDWQNMEVADWASHTTVPGMYIAERVELYNDILPSVISHDVDVLFDVGCGFGEDSIAIAKAFPHINIVGLDFNEKFLEKARELVTETGEESLQKRVSFAWVDLRQEMSSVEIMKLKLANSNKKSADNVKALFYMGGNTIGIMPKGLEATIAKGMGSLDQFLVVAHDMTMLSEMYETYYKKCVGEMDEEKSDFQEGLYVSKGDYRSQWYSPGTLTDRIETCSKILTEVSCKKGKEAGVFGVYALPGLATAKFGLPIGRTWKSPTVPRTLPRTLYGGL